MPKLTGEEIAHFLHEQVEAWNGGDKDRFFTAYRRVAPQGLLIEYVGRQPPGDGWPILESMWANQNGQVRAEAVATLVNGSEAACYHLNHVAATGATIKTVELYAFSDGALAVRYFTGA
jgi:hypothetical protein